MENRVFTNPILPVAKDRYRLEAGWRLAGWADAPFDADTGPHAIVYEKLIPPDTNGSLAWSDFEPGIYWGHGNAEKMYFGGSLR